MELMNLRRGLMAQMANGAQFVKGTFTVQSSGNNQTLNFGKTFSKYLFVIEATETSKTTIMGTGLNSARTYALIGQYPYFKVGENTSPTNIILYSINPSTNAMTTTTVGSWTVTEDSITFPIIDVSSGQHYLYYGLEYRYYIVEIKD